MARGPGADAADRQRRLRAASPGPHRRSRTCARAGWTTGPGAPGRGDEPFVPVSWDTALDLLAGELRRVYRDHGAEAVYGGSYGWASAGRFHHAQSQVHRFLNCLGGYVRHVNSYSLGTSTVLLPYVIADVERAAEPRHGQVRDRGAQRAGGRLRRAVAEERGGVAGRGVPAPCPRLDERRAGPGLPVRLREPAARRHARRGAGRVDRAAARHRRRADARARPGARRRRPGRHRLPRPLYGRVPAVRPVPARRGRRGRQGSRVGCGDHRGASGAHQGTRARDGRRRAPW